MPVDALTDEAQSVILSAYEQFSALDDARKLVVLKKLSEEFGMMEFELRQKMQDDQDDKEMAGRHISYLPPCPVCGKTDKLAVQVRFLRVPDDGRPTRVVTQCVCRHDTCFRSNKSGGNRYTRAFVKGLDDDGVYNTVAGKIDLQAEQAQLRGIR